MPRLFSSLKAIHVLAINIYLISIHSTELNYLSSHPALISIGSDWHRLFGLSQCQFIFILLIEIDDFIIFEPKQFLHRIAGLRLFFYLCFYWLYGHHLYERNMLSNSMSDRVEIFIISCSCSMYVQFLFHQSKD